MNNFPDNKPEKKLSAYKRLQMKAGFFLFQLLTASLLLGFVGWWGYSQVMKMALGKFSLFNWSENVDVEYTEDQILLLSPIRSERFIHPEDYEEPDEWPYKPRNDDWQGADTLWYAAGMRNPKEESNAWNEIVQSNYTESHLVDWWENLFIIKEIEYKLIYENDLINLRKGKNVLILPGALLLSKEEKQGIKDFVASGGSLLACWSPGCRDETGKWVGFEFLSQLLGGFSAGTVYDQAGGTSAILKGGTPTTGMVPPGTHLDLYTYNGNIGFDIVEPRTHCDAFWFKPYWRDRSSGINKKNAAIARGSYIDGRFIWLSFIPETVQEHKDNNIIVESVVLNSIAWLKREAVVVANVWPAGYSAGGGILMKTNNFNDNFYKSMSAAQNAGINPDIIFNPDSSSDIKPMGIPSQGDVIIATDSDKPLFGTPLKGQVSWIDNRIKTAEKITGKRPSGLFEVNWEEDLVTLQAAAKTDIRVIFADKVPRSYGPKVREIRPDFFSRLVAIGTMPKAQLTAEEWSAQGFGSSDKLFEGMTADMQRIVRTGGVYFSMIDPDILNKAKAFDLTERLNNQMELLNIWHVPTSKLIERYNAWNGLRVSSSERTQTRIIIRISNEGKLTMNDVYIEVFLSNDIERVSLSSELVGTTPRDVKWNKDKGICSFIIPKLDPRDNASLTLDKITRQAPNL